MAKRMPSRWLLLAPIFLVFASAPARSDTLTVRKDGTGQFTTINAAKAAAVSGDIIEVGPGVYPEEIDFSIAVTLVSTDGAATTILDGEHLRRVLIFRAGLGSVVDGFTIRDGVHASSGAGLRVQLGATATVRNCVFEGNHVAFDGGAVICRDAGSRLDMSSCTFRNNTADRYAGAVLIVESGAGSFDHCVFENNSGPLNGAIATNTLSNYSITNCLFVGNEGVASAIFAANSTLVVTNNTFYDNPAGDACMEVSFSNSTFLRNVIVGDGQGAGILQYGNSSFLHSCNLFWSVPGGAIEGGVLASDELVADPLFCDALNGDFGINTASPAAPEFSACDQLIGAYPVECGSPPLPISPAILSILDVPNDQGRQVRVRWERSRYDGPGQPETITGYAVYRYQGEFFSALVAPPVRSSKGDPQIDGWDFITTVPARGDEIYQCVAPTLCDKPKNGDPCWSVFFVSALTPDPLTYYDSDPDSGYSQDNLPPGPPSTLVLQLLADGASLDWQASPDTDVTEYRIYRGIGADPVPGPASLIHSTSETEWADFGAPAGSRYLVSSVDGGGNESTMASPGTTTGADGATPTRFALRQNSPNPFNPITVISYDVPAGGGHVSIDIFDVAGRRVRGLLNEHRAAGTWVVQWDGTTDAGSHASSGVYFYRLRAPGFEKTLRMTLIE